jgi:phosphomannomutase
LPTFRHALPPADRVQEINRDKAARFLSSLIEDDTARETFFAPTGSIKSVDLDRTACG